ncbi:hypothetical protein [Micrococcus luteus]|uniref:hypothetical protein n=1 Tax=Micrococcus luteus TaxID=1270 RepID=UPI0023025D59|nr:hypothetical protein [Micrococcus luteus]
MTTNPEHILAASRNAAGGTWPTEPRTAMVLLEGSQIAATLALSRRGPAAADAADMEFLHTIVRTLPALANRFPDATTAALVLHGDLARDDLAAVVLKQQHDDRDPSRVPLSCAVLDTPQGPVVIDA